MLPIPFERFIPKIYRRSSTLIALADKADQQIQSLNDEIISVSTFIDPVRIPALVIDEMGFLLNAGFLGSDSIIIRRRKLANAIQGHKNRGTWNDDAKLRVDAFVGGDSQLISADVLTSDDSIVMGGVATEPDTYWSIFGADGVDLLQGIAVIGGGDEVVLPGVIQIDVDSSTLTTDEVERLKLELEDIAPAYFRVFLGYLSAGVFVPYPNGEIT